MNKIEAKWLDLALPKEQFDDLVRIGNFIGDVEWNKFFALAASALGSVRTTSETSYYSLNSLPEGCLFSD